MITPTRSNHLGRVMTITQSPSVLDDPLWGAGQLERDFAAAAPVIARGSIWKLGRLLWTGLSSQWIPSLVGGDGYMIVMLRCCRSAGSQSPAAGEVGSQFWLPPLGVRGREFGLSSPGSCSTYPGEPIPGLVGPAQRSRDSPHGVPHKNEGVAVRQTDIVNHCHGSGPHVRGCCARSC